MNIKELQKKIHAQNVAAGWWDEPRKFGTLVALVHSELSEALEGDRKSLMDDHLPNRKMAEVELAYTVIRILGMAEFYGIDCSGEPLDKTRFYNLMNGFEEFGEYLALSHCMMDNAFMDHIGLHGDPDYMKQEDMLCSAIFVVKFACERYGFDLESAVDEKLAYNLNRADHKRENRALENGKKY